MFKHFYHRLLRKYVTIFGTLFNNIYLTRYTQQGLEKETFKVPLVYGPKEKWLTRIKSDPTLTKSIMVSVPRFSFEIVGITYDAERKQQTKLKLQGPSVGGSSIKTTYTAAPYNIDFSLSLYVRNIEDGTQIAEQILPYFQPDFIVTATLIPEMQLKKDIPILLNSVNQSIDYEGGLDTTRLVIWQFDFTLKGYFFGPSSNTGVIMGNTSDNGNTGGVIVNLYNDVPGRTIQTVYLSNVSDQNFIEGEVVRSHAHSTANVHPHTVLSTPSSESYGTVLAWNRDQGKLSIINTQGFFDVPHVVIADTSHATGTIASVSTNPLKLAEITVQQDPLTANVSTDFGYSEQLTEFPDTL
jgi:hypothetical protein